MLDFSRELIRVAPIAIIPPLVIGLVKFGKLSPELKVITYQLILAGLTEVIADIIRRVQQNNLPLLHIFTVLEFGCITWFYWIVLKGSTNRKLIPWTGLGFLIVSVFNSIFVQTIYQFNTYTRSLEAVLAIVFSLLCFHHILSEMKIKRLDQSPVFWVNTGYLLYFSGAFFLFIMSNFILPLNQHLNINVWAVHAFLCIVLYSTFSIALWRHRSK